MDQMVLDIAVLFLTYIALFHYINSSACNMQKTDEHSFLVFYTISKIIFKYNKPMPIIESYSFGRMTIDGRNYAKDVIIYPDGSILTPWWRNQGHVLVVDDIRDLIAAEPEIIICGTGAMGVMRPATELKEHLAASNIEFIAQKSSLAVETFNQLSGNRKVGGCFHLTC
jgi:hypothetical protein